MVGMLKRSAGGLFGVSRLGDLRYIDPERPDRFGFKTPKYVPADRNTLTGRPDLFGGGQQAGGGAGHRGPRAWRAPPTWTRSRWFPTTNFSRHKTPHKPVDAMVLMRLTKKVRSQGDLGGKRMTFGHSRPGPRTAADVATRLCQESRWSAQQQTSRRALWTLDPASAGPWHGDGR